MLVLLLLASLLPRIPLLHAAAANFGADEAVDALVIKRLLERGEITFFNWDATYYGIAEGLLSLPFVATLGFGPLAFKLGAVAGFLALLVAVFVVARRLDGLPAAIGAGAVLAFFSPQLVLWSTIAAGGYCLVVAWGAWTLLLADRVLPKPGPAGMAALGAMVGFGLYIYQLYLVFASLVALAAAVALVFAWTRARAGASQRRRLVGASALFAFAFLLGWSPYLVRWARGGLGTKQPSYVTATGPQALANFELLVNDIAPALLGANPMARATIESWVGPPAATPDVSWILLALPAIAWGYGAFRVARQIGSRRPASLLQALVVLLVPWTAVVFVLSSNPSGPLATRYLLPWVASLPVLIGSLFARLWSRSRLAGAILLFVFVSLSAGQMASWTLGPGMELWYRSEPLVEVIAYLERHRVQGAYSWYWAAYKATALSGERLIVAPMDDWDRFPPYTHYVDRLERVAYIFQDTEDPQLGERAAMVLDVFRNRLDSGSIRVRERRFGSYLVFHAPDFRRLVGPRVNPPLPLAAPRAELKLMEPPRTATAGETLHIHVEVVNRSDAGWSATGDPLLAGSNRVAAAYRWYDEAGHSLVDNPDRSLLPADLGPGESLRMWVRAKVPDLPGRYGLAVTLVQENVAWFDIATGSVTERVVVEVAAPE